MKFVSSQSEPARSTINTVGRTVIDPVKLPINTRDAFYCLTTKFSAHICGQSFSVFGYPYTSQTTDVNACAHSALWGVCRYLSERYSPYGEPLPFDIVRITDTAQGRTFPYKGMTYADYSRILAEFGVFPIVLRT